MAVRFSDQFDFSNCEDEPIRTPGLIQPHGALLLLDADSLAITGFSDNAAARLEQATGQPVCSWNPDSEPLQNLLQPLQRDSNRSGPWPVRYTLPGSNGPWQVTVNKRNQRLCLELEQGRPQLDTTVSDLANLIAQVKSARTVDELLQTAAVAVRSITGYDRVMVYRFAEDWHGEVVAESLGGALGGFLGLHFPATDIPSQARALYRENEIRMIADVDAETVPITSLSDLAEDTNPDLSDSALRAVSPIHLRYLRNMGVGASMSISLIKGGALWGLIACHHTTARYVSVDARLAAKLVGDVLSMCLRLVEDSDVMKARLRQNLRQTSLLEQLVQSDQLVPTLVDRADDLRRLFDASGFAVVEDDHVRSSGHCPGDTDVRTLARYVRLAMADQKLSLYARESWDEELFPEHTVLAAGVMAMAPGSDLRVIVLWMRAEEAQTINWAGKAEKVPDDPLNPRASFERWSEQRRGQARRWQDWEMEAAEDLLSALQKLALRQMERLQRWSENLARSNQDLEDFAFIASHDLQEPMRKIESFSSMITEELDETDPDTGLVRDYLQRITGASARLRSLVSDLLTYSRVGRLDYENRECDWGKTVHRTVEMLDLGADDRRADVSVEGSFPVTRSSPVLLRMMFQNLLSNALKYSDQERFNQVRVSGSETLEGGWEVRVSDTGIGFDPKMKEAIFKPFHRLNSKSRYAGSGIGLAIVRKAADRLGVTVVADSVPGEGSEFVVIIPPDPGP